MRFVMLSEEDYKKAACLNIFGDENRRNLLEEYQSMRLPEPQKDHSYLIRLPYAQHFEQGETMLIPLGFRIEFDQSYHHFYQTLSLVDSLRVKVIAPYSLYKQMAILKITADKNICCEARQAVAVIVPD